LAVLTERISHHQFSPRCPGGILRLGHPSVHFFDAAEPRIRIERLADGNAEVAKELAPLLLHVELDLGALLRILYGLVKGRLEL